MEDLEVGPVVEDAAAWAGEDAPVRAWWVVLEMLAKGGSSVASMASVASVSASAMDLR